MATFAYQPTILQGTTKKGKLRCDPDGYYDMIVGGFDTYNSAGAYYTFNSAKSHFDSSHHFQRRIAGKKLFGEAGHPKPIPGMSKQDWMIRVLTIDEKSVSHHIKELHIDDSLFRNKDGGRIVTVFARLKPAGPFAESLGLSLDDNDQDTAFSIRSITMDRINPVNGVLTKEMQEIVTYDWVIEPGIEQATKYHNPALEQLDLHTFTQQNLNDAIARARDLFTGMESDDIVERLERLKRQPEIPRGIVGAAVLPRSAHWK
jgi:hypothetical protein